MATLTKARKAAPIRLRDQGKLIFLGAEVRPDLAKAVTNYKMAKGATIRFIITKALDQYMTREGFFPLQEQR